MNRVATKFMYRVCVIGNWRKGDSYYKVTKNLAELCSCVLQKVDLANHELEYLAEEISKHC